MPFQFSSDTPETWNVVHESGHRYTMYERLTREEALAIRKKQKEISRLTYDIDHASNDEELQILIEQRHAVHVELTDTMGLVLRRCLRLTPEQYDEMDSMEAFSIFLKIVEFCI